MIYDWTMSISASDSTNFDSVFAIWYIPTTTRNCSDVDIGVFQKLRQLHANDLASCVTKSTTAMVNKGPGPLWEWFQLPVQHHFLHDRKWKYIFMFLDINSILNGLNLLQHTGAESKNIPVGNIC